MILRGANMVDVEVKYSDKQIAIEDINRLAYEIKYKNLNEIDKMAKEARLIGALIYLQNKNPKLLYSEERQEQSTYLFMETTFNAYVSSMKAYGKVDIKTGEVIPFAKLFLSHLKFASYNVCRLLPDGTKIEVDNEETQAREAMAKNSLRALANMRNIKGYVLPKRIRSSMVFQQELIKLGVTEEEAKELADDVFSGTKHVSGDISENEGLVGERKYTVGGYSSPEVDFLADIVTDFLKSDGISVRDKQYLKYYLTKIIYLENVQLNMTILELIDEEYFRALSEDCDNRSEIDVLAELLDLKSDTVRKNLKAVENALRKFKK